MKTRILTRRIVALSTITAASEAADGPASNLLHENPGLPWVGDPALANFTLDIGTALAQLEIAGYDTVMVIYAVRTEVGASGTAKVDVANTTGGLSSPAASSGVLPFRMTTDLDPSWEYFHWFYVFPTTRTETKLRFTFSFPGATEVKLSGVLVDLAYCPSHTIAPGFAMTPVEGAVINRTMGAVTWAQARPLVRSGPIQIEASGPEAPQRVQGELGRLYREVGESSPVGLILNDAPTNFAMDQLFYGRLKATSPFPLAMPDFGLWSVGFEFTESGSVSRNMG